MTQWLAGMKITAERLSSFTPDIDTSGVVTIATGWVLQSCVGTRVGGTTQVLVRVSRASGQDITSPASGNIGSFPMFTVATEWLPNAQAYGSELMPFITADGFAEGSALFNSATGICTLETWTPNQSVTDDRFLRVFLEYAS